MGKIKTYKLYNLDLGQPPFLREFKIGPYEIELVDDYDEIQKRLSSLRTSRSEIVIEDGELKENPIETIPGKKGESLVTATVKCSNEPKALLSNKKTTAIWDLCLILSYLLGRRVYTEEEERRFPHTHYGFKIVQDHHIHQAAQKAWVNRSNFKSDGEVRPLWYYLHINDTPEAEVKILLGCVVLEFIQNLESDESDMEIDEDLNNLIGDLKEVIRKSNINKAQKDAFVGVISNWGKSSFTERFRNLMFKYEFIDNNLKGKPLKRIKAINRFRNMVVHSGTIYYPNWVKGEEDKTTLSHFYAVQFIPSLIQEFLNRKFDISKQFDWTRQTSELIKEYINKGTWDGENMEDSI